MKGTSVEPLSAAAQRLLDVERDIPAEDWRCGLV